jgi:MYXO-CTERM domain-containing protein
MCATGFCADGLCCDTACDTLCQACTAALKQSGDADGTCGPARNHTNPHHDACPTSAPSTCGPDGRCDGKGACRLYYLAGTSCSPDSSCIDGVQTVATTCDGNGACPPPTTSPCGAFACGATACLESCTSPADCTADNICDAATHTCGPPMATCDGDHTTIGTNGKTKDCMPFKCQADGMCKQTCSNVDDCVSPNSCTSAGQCAMLAAEPSDSASGCNVRPASGAPGGGGSMLIAIGLAAAMRRRRTAR